MLIGFAGHKGAGKDTAAQFLVDELGFTRLAFADKLKEAVANLFGINRQIVDEFKEIGIDGLPVVEVALQQYNKTEWVYSWREFLQRFGTEMGRNTFGEDFWVKQWQNALPTAVAMEEIHAVAYHPRTVVTENIVATDVRFENEAIAINRLGGYTVEIVRPDYEPDGHTSEEPLPREWVDAQIVNNGTLEDLKISVYDLYKKLQR